MCFLALWIASDLSVVAMTSVFFAKRKGGEKSPPFNMCFIKVQNSFNTLCEA